jgi:hypothetical protein
VSADSLFDAIFRRHTNREPYIARFQNVADGDIAAHGRAIRDYLAA